MSLADRARRLVAASERTSFDPFTEIDWSQPVTDDQYHLPPEILPLYGTAQWEAMDDAERRAYSRHECAALCAAGIYFENILMRLVLEHLASMGADDPSHRYLLVETADECRHSAMFGEYIRRAGTPSYQPGLHLQLGRSLMLAVAGRAEGYVAILAAEELLDICNRATMSDERVSPLSRAIAKIHVMEEARHMSYARAWLTENWSTVGRLDRLRASTDAPFIVAGVVDAMINPAVYRELGIAGGWRAARFGPWRHRVTDDLERLTDFLATTGVITGVTRPVWQALGLVRG